MMTWSWRLERAYWATEIPVLVRRGWWLLVLIVVLTMFNAIPFVGQLINWLLVVAIGTVVVRRVIASLRFATLERDRWQFQMANWITGVWPSLAVQLGLEVRTYSGQKLVTGAGRPTWHGDTCILPVSMPAGLAREDLVAASGRIAQAFNAVRVTVTGAHVGELALRIDYVDALAEPFSFPLGGTWDGASVLMGVTDGGEEWRLPLGPHTLVAGSSGSGKASLVWGLLLGLVQPIHSGLVEVWGIDRKGGMELAMGRDLLTRFASDAAHSVALLEEAVQVMQARARDLAGVTRQHTATAESPTVVVLIDELAALTAYETDREMLRRANAAIATLASQGRAVGFILFACLQDPRKETLPARGLFTQTVGLRLRDRVETGMVLGDGAVAAGAMCHEISPRTPGVAYVLPEDGAPPERVRAAYAADEQIRDAALGYFAPNPRPIELPEADDGPKPRRPRARRNRETTETKEES
ncbi:MAG: FtsK/SpoIIIE domain-containing protein [Microbacterium sp.]